MKPGTQHQFGYEWDIYREILPFYKEQFSRWIAPLKAEDFKGKSFLDAGCGIGRNSYWPLQAGAEKCLAVDFDERTVAVAAENLKAFPNCEVRHQSIYDLEELERFDIVFSIGVIHHLAEPKRAVERLVRALKPGGKLVLWVYAREGNEKLLRILEPIRKGFTSRLPLPVCRWIAKCVALPLHLYLLFPHRNRYLKLLQQMSLRHRESIVFDQLLPSIANYWTKAEVIALVNDCPVAIQSLQHTNGMSWTLVAAKEIERAPGLSNGVPSTTCIPGR